MMTTPLNNFTNTAVRYTNIFQYLQNPLFPVVPPYLVQETPSHPAYLYVLEVNHRIKYIISIQNATTIRCLPKKESVKAYPAHQGTQVSQTPLCFLVDPEGLGVQVTLFPLVYQALLVALLVPGWALASDSSHSEKHPTLAPHLEHNLLTTRN